MRWKGLNIKPALRHWEEQPALASVDDTDRLSSLTFALPQKPVYGHPYLSHQHIAVSDERFRSTWTSKSAATFFSPYGRSRMRYYDRELHFLGIIRRLTRDSTWTSCEFYGSLCEYAHPNYPGMLGT